MKLYLRERWRAFTDPYYATNYNTVAVSICHEAETKQVRLNNEGKPPSESDQYGFFCVACKQPTSYKFKRKWGYE